MTWKDKVEEFQGRRPDHALPPDWEDLEFLHEMCERKQPAFILEFGSGCSTVVFSEYAQRTGSMLICIEDDPEWFQVNRDALRETLRLTHTRMIFSPIEQVGRFLLRYINQPFEVVDLCYVDGPWLPADQFFVWNPMEMTANTFVVDGRVTQTEIMRTMLTLDGRYKMTIDQEHFRSVFEKAKPAAMEKPNAK